MDQLSSDAVVKFKEQNPSLFCRASIRTSTKCDVITSNMAETFNHYLMRARVKHLIDMMEENRSTLIQRLYNNRKKMEKSLGDSPRIAQKMNLEKVEAAKCSPLPCTNDVFQIYHEVENYVVNLGTKSCSCRKWDMTNIPCCHAISVISLVGEETEDYLHQCYMKVTYLSPYSNHIPALVGEKGWPRVELKINPPAVKIGQGRLRKNRIKKPHEDPKKPKRFTKHGVTMSCSICNSTTHNKRKCPDKNNVPQDTQKKQKTTDQPQETPTTQTHTTHDHFLGVSQASVTFTHSSGEGRGIWIWMGRGRHGKGRGRGAVVASLSKTSSNAHSDQTTQPSKTGKGNKLIIGGKGCRGGKTSRLEKVPTGYGVLIGED